MFPSCLVRRMYLTCPDCLICLCVSLKNSFSAVSTLGARKTSRWRTTAATLADTTGSTRFSTTEGSTGGAAPARCVCVWENCEGHVYLKSRKIPHPPRADFSKLGCSTTQRECHYEPKSPCRRALQEMGQTLRTRWCRRHRLFSF